MLFNSFSYLLFLPTVLALYWCMPARLRKPFLLGASYFFYMSWRPAYGLLILGLTVVNYILGLAISRKRAKSILILGLVFNLGALCYFKYTNFLFEALFAALGFATALTDSTLTQSWQQPVLNIILPLGISFFTFEFIHYIVDVYRGSKPVKSFVDFALFASFFPSQIAGPIKRFQDFMLQMQECPKFKSQQFREGTFLILQGLFKKVVLGDNLSPIVAHGFNNPMGLGLVDAWITVIGFSYQLYFDFSGYTDIGRGSALLLGYKVPENFNLPFLAANLTDFWRRWHISLSTWLRDYLFISLGGSRGSTFKTKRNLILTMVLGGLWHGAAWHFVIWGAVHGFGLTVFKDWSQFISRSSNLAQLQKLKIWHIAGVIFTNLFVYLAFAVFRAANLDQAGAVISRFFGVGVTALTGVVATQVLQSPLTIAVPVYIAYLLARLLIARLDASGTNLVLQPFFAFWDRTLSARLVTYATVLIALMGFAPSQFSPFIYFQF
jgi:D-alanyl-lipoteichoic acid acyltransferase DltB (MBOAT superfamily)